MAVNQQICVLFLRYCNNCEINETINLTDKQEFLFYIYDADGVFRSKKVDTFCIQHVIGSLLIVTEYKNMRYKVTIKHKETILFTCARVMVINTVLTGLSVKKYIN